MSNPGTKIRAISSLSSEPSTSSKRLQAEDALVWSKVPKPDAPDAVHLRSGHPVRARDRIQVRTKRLSADKPLFLFLSGEVLGIYEDNSMQHEIDMIDVRNAHITRLNMVMFMVKYERRAYYCSTNHAIETVNWVDNLLYAQQRSFNKNYVLGAVFVTGRRARLHYAYRARVRGNAFAVKVTRRSSRPSALEEMDRERYIHTCVKHPCVIRAHDVFASLDNDYIVMDLKTGGNLKDFLRKQGPVPEDKAREIFLQVASGLHHLHLKGIVHRDVQPSNILIESEVLPWRVYIADFSSAEIISADKMDKEKLKGMYGNPKYMAVEMVRQELYGPAVDMWSLGILLYEMLSGEVPFQGSSSRFVRRQIIQGGPIDFTSASWNSISSSAISLVKQLLQEDSAKRCSALACTQHDWITHVYKDLAQHGQFAGDTDSSSTETLSTFRRRSNRRSLPNILGSPPPNRSPPSFVDALEMQKTHRGSIMRSTRSQRTNSECEQLFTPLRDRAISTLSGEAQPVPLAKSVLEISSKGLWKMVQERPHYFQHVSQNPVFQKQLRCCFKMRRKLYTITVAIVFTLRLRAVSKNQCFTRKVKHLQNPGMLNVVDYVCKERMEAIDMEIEEKQRRAAVEDEEIRSIRGSINVNRSIQDQDQFQNANCSENPTRLSKLQEFVRIVRPHFSSRRN